MAMDSHSYRLRGGMNDFNIQIREVNISSALVRCCQVTRLGFVGNKNAMVKLQEQQAKRTMCCYVNLHEKCLYYSYAWFFV